MKLKNMLMTAFLVITIIPIAIASILLYKSGFDLSKESYTRNLAESLNVQADYISETIKNNMISDYRFASNTIASKATTGEAFTAEERDLYEEVTLYLSNAEDKIAVCLLLDQEHMPLYSIGEKKMIDAISAQMSKPSDFTKQKIMEFDLGDATYSLGIVTPIWEADTYKGCMVSVYDKSYIFKIISSYYEIADTSTYVCRENGDIINSRQLSVENSEEMQNFLHGLTFSIEGAINTHTAGSSLSGFYKNIRNTPWYLVGFVDDALILSFTNQFLLIYIVIILGILIVAIILSFYFSRRVVKPINSLVQVMEGYQNSLDGKELWCQEEGGYAETKYLRTKFLELMKKILLVQHNFEGVYQLYQSNGMGDTNIDIDVTNQIVLCNKDEFQELLKEIEVPEGVCVVEKFTRSFCEKDQHLLMGILEAMRDEHLSVTQEIEVYTPYLGEKWFHALIVPMYTNERLSRLFVQLRDVSSFKKQELESGEQAKRDVLTGLYNRAGFVSSVDKALESASETDLHALLFIDMNYFKMVNDNLGHAAGDELLQAISKTLLEATGRSGIVARFGGDEFVVFLSRTSQAEMLKLKQSLKDRLVYPFHTDKKSFVVSASIGDATWKQDSSSALQELLKQADEAMYEAKRKFKEEVQR